MGPLPQHSTLGCVGSGAASMSVEMILSLHWTAVSASGVVSNCWGKEGEGECSGAPGRTSQSGLWSVCHGKREAVSHCISFLHHCDGQFTLVQIIWYEKGISSRFPCSSLSSHSADCHLGCPLGEFYNGCCFILLISVKKGGKSALHKIAQTQMLKEYIYFN